MGIKTKNVPAQSPERKMKMENERVMRLLIENKQLQARIEVLEKELNKISVGDDESDPYGYIPRDEFRDIAKQALKGGE